MRFYTKLAIAAFVSMLLLMTLASFFGWERWGNIPPP
jgi:hypothetical protein